MAGTKKDFTDHGYSQYSIGTLGVTNLFSVASVGAGAVSTTVQASFVTPSRIKLSSIAVAVASVSTIDGSIGFNIVVGSGSYESAATYASGTFTITGAPITTKNNVYVIGGHTATAPQTTGNSVTVQAAADVIVINAVPTIAALGVATSSLGVITFTANEPGPNGNAITTTVSVTAGGDAVAASGATLTGGSFGTVTATVQNDNRTLPYLQQAATSNQVQIAGGGSGITTNFALPGQALFASDVEISATNTPGILTSGGSAVFGDVPTALGLPVLAASDAVFERGQVLTLRVTTPVGTGAITGLIVSALSEVRNLNEPSTPSEVQLNDPLQGFVTPLTPGNITIANVRPVSGVTF